MIDIRDKVKCSGCSACYNACPVTAIEMVEDNEGFLYPQIDLEKCVRCNLCEKVCPYINAPVLSNDLEKCYTAYNTDEKEREISSSGGIFILLAKEIISCGGVVFGSIYDEEFMAIHSYTDSEKDLDIFVGSKYMQSKIGHVYTEAKKYLSDGRRVLFVGTACQIGGLKGFLMNDYPNLICVDFICLGVPSPRVWKDYLRTYFNNEIIEYVNFKNKKLGWHSFSLNIKTNKKNFCRNGRQTYFFSGYFKQLYSRPSCSNCLFKGDDRISDITISDCWGYSHIAPEMDDNKGLSSIECHTVKGLELFDAIKRSVCWKESSIDDVKKYNSNYWLSAEMGKDREAFWEDYNRLPKKKLFRKYCSPERPSLFRRLKGIVKHVLGR